MEHVNPRLTGLSKFHCVLIPSEEKINICLRNVSVSAARLELVLLITKPGYIGREREM